MLRRKDARSAATDAVDTVAPIAEQLANDPKLRHRVMGAIGAAEAARRRALPATGLVAVAARIATDRELQANLKQMVAEIEEARARVRRRRSHKLRNTMLLLVGAGGAAVAFVPKVRETVMGRSTPSVGGPTTIEEEIEVGVPVSTAYNQWTQFEDFPLFMEGVDHVEQLDDTRLRWVASIGGRRAEWEAKIVEQQPDTRIVWESSEGRETRGTVAFHEVGENRTRIRLTMVYRPQGPIEKAGSVAGLDRRRVRGDLERFRDLIESRGAESGAWRGEVESGTATTT
ncbi:MAG: SRPBCC family protein [Pseudomonadota bacterium]